MKIVDITDFSDKLILWKKHELGLRYWYSEIDGDILFLRMNNFPDEPLYTLISKKTIRDYDDLPDRWVLE